MAINATKKGLLGVLGSCLVAAALLGGGVARAQVQGVTDTEILVGSVLDLSGPVASAGVPFKEAMTLAAEDINAAGGIHGRKIRFIPEDSSFDPKKAVLVTQKLLTQDKVFAMVATIGSAIIQATMPLVLERNVPMLFPAVASDMSYLPYHPLKFGMMVTARQQFQAEIKYAYEKLGKRRFAILYQDDETGLSFLRAAEEQLKLHGLSLVEKTTHKRGEINYSSQITLLKAANPDMLVLGTNPREVAAARVEARAQNWAVDALGPTITPTIISLAGQSAEGLYGAAQILGAAQTMTPALKAVSDRFTARFGHPFTDPTSTGYGYTAMMLFAEGAKNAGRDLTPQSFAKGLEQVKNFKSAFAMVPVSYGPENHAPNSDVIVMQVKGGKWVPVGGAVAE